MLSITLLLLYFFLFMGPSCNQLYIYTYASPFFFFQLSLGSLNIKRILLPPTPSYLMSPSWRYIPSLCMHSYCHMLSCAFSLPFHHFILFACLFISSSCLNIHLLSFSSSFFFVFVFRLITSPFLFFTPRVKRSLLLCAYLWRVSLMGWT